MKVFTIFNEKGGSAKTTTVLNLYGELTAAGHSVVIIDTDAGGRAITAIAGRSGGDLKERVYPAGSSDPDYLEGLIVEVTKKHKADFVLIDTPPRFGEEFNSASLFADVFVVPGKTSLQDRSLTVKTAKMFARDRSKRPTYILPTGIVKQQIMSQMAMDDYNSVEGAVVLPSIMHSTVVEQAIELGEPVATYNPKASVRNNYCAAFKTILEDA